MPIINTEQAPAAIGPYSQAVHEGKTLYTSGQLPLNPDTMEFAGPDIESQTRQSLLNLERIVVAAGGSLKNVVKTTCFLSDMNNFAAFNKVYAEFFDSNPPARSCVEVARLPKDALVEVEAIAIIRK